MNLENMIVLDQEDRVLFIGERGFSFLSTKKKYPLGSAEGKPEVGDLILYFAKRPAERADEVSWLKEKFRFEKKISADESLILVCCLDRQELQPLAKCIAKDLPKTATLLDIMYESNAIVFEKKGDVLEVHLNAQTVTFPYEETGSLYVVAKERKIHHFGFAGLGESLDLYPLLAQRKYPAWIREEAVLDQKAGKVLNEELYKAIRELADTEETYLHVGAATYCVKKTEKRLQDKTYSAILIGNAEDILKEMSEASASYKKILRNVPQGILPQGNYNAFRLLGDDDKVKEVTRFLQKASVTNTTILLTGESGTGKTFIAGEIHKASRRSGGPFIHVNCAAIPYNLMESELFGYEEGAFTGARKGGKKGYFEMAYGGTLFLDEIGEIPLQLQGKLLEVLQSKTFFHVGGTRQITSDVRVIAATNKNLKEMVREKRFREDLFYRINVFPIDIPPLRERRSGLYSIVMDILPDVCSRLGIEPLVLSSQAYKRILQYPWPGNIRELENVLEKAAILSNGKIILSDDILLPDAADSFMAVPVTLQEIKESAERNAIVNALRMYQGDKEMAAKYLNIGRTNMFDKIKKYHIRADEVE